MRIDSLLKLSQQSMIDENKKHFFTGECNLYLKREELLTRLSILESSYETIFNSEYQILTGNGYVKEIDERIFIPNWDDLIVMINDFYLALGLPEM
jgi:hypothetical protein